MQVKIGIGIGVGGALLTLVSVLILRNRKDSSKKDKSELKSDNADDGSGFITTDHEEPS
jgi:hypothetical protein